MRDDKIKNRVSFDEFCKCRKEAPTSGEERLTMEQWRQLVNEGDRSHYIDIGIKPDTKTKIRLIYCESPDENNPERKGDDIRLYIKDLFCSLIKNENAMQERVEASNKKRNYDVKIANKRKVIKNDIYDKLYETLYTTTVFSNTQRSASEMSNTIGGFSEASITKSSLGSVQNCSINESRVQNHSQKSISSTYKLTDDVNTADILSMVQNYKKKEKHKSGSCASLDSNNERFSYGNVTDNNRACTISISSRKGKDSVSIYKPIVMKHVLNSLWNMRPHNGQTDETSGRNNQINTIAKSNSLDNNSKKCSSSKSMKCSRANVISSNKNIQESIRRQENLFNDKTGDNIKEITSFSSHGNQDPPSFKDQVRTHADTIRKRMLADLRKATGCLNEGDEKVSLLKDLLLHMADKEFDINTGKCDNEDASLLEEYSRFTERAKALMSCICGSEHRESRAISRQ